MSSHADLSYLQEYTIEPDWRYRSTVLTPMFVETQASLSSLQTRTQEGSLLPRGPAARQIRATQQQYDFTPTQTTGDQLPALFWGLEPSKDAFFH